MLPTVSFDDVSGTYIFTLWRDGKKVIHELKGLNVYLEVIPDDDYETTGNVKHYIYVRPYEGEDILISLSKDEYDVLDPILLEIEEERYESQSYEFTRSTIKDMAKNPTDYPPGMRARAMVSCPVCDGALVGSVYRPHCESCSWDSNDGHNAYREHPLDHE
jgi:hypothetical protein